MTRIQRTILFYVFLLAFLIIAPTLILHTAGYRYNFKDGRLARVGVLTLKSKPENAAIELNGHAAKEQTPATFELSPDEYEITISKPGYHAWNKTLTVQSQQTTFAEDIILWKNLSPSLIFQLNPQVAQFSPDGKTAMVSDPIMGLIIYHVPSQTLTPLIDLPAQPKIQFSPDGNQALISYDENDQTKFLVASVSDDKILDTDFINRFGFDHLSWSETAGALYGVRNKTIYSAGLFTNQINAVAQGDHPFVLHGTTAWSIDHRDRVLLNKSSVGEPDKIPESMVELPRGDYELLPIDAPYLLLHEQTRDTISLIDTRRPTEIIFEAPGTQAIARENSQNELEFLVWNDFELRQINAVTGETSLLRRQGTPINAVAWFLDKEYVMMASSGVIETIGLDHRDKRVITTLTQFDGQTVNNFAIPAHDNALLYFTVSGDSDVGLYSLEL